MTVYTLSYEWDQRKTLSQGSLGTGAVMTLCRPYGSDGDDADHPMTMWKKDGTRRIQPTFGMNIDRYSYYYCSQSPTQFNFSSFITSN